MKQGQSYIHKKTGNVYSIVQENFMFKENGVWKKNLVLYKAEYPNPDGPYFSRTREDFEKNFEPKEVWDNCLNCPQKNQCWPNGIPNGIVKEENKDK